MRLRDRCGAGARTLSCAVLAALAALAALPGCGLGIVDDDSGGGDHLPTQGAGPYGKLPFDLGTPGDEPYVITVFQVNARDPAALRRQDGGFRLWFGWDEPGSVDSAIGRAEIPALGALPDVSPAVVLRADQAWEQGWVGAPSVIEADGGLVMFYQGGADGRGIGRADSLDGGVTWQKHAENPIIAGAGRPGVVLLPDGRWVLYVTRLDAPGIFAAESVDGERFALSEVPALLPRVDMAGAYDRYTVSDPFPVVRRTAAGRLHHGLFFTGADKPDEAISAIGWAGSYDGVEWRRFASPDEPVLAPGGVSELGPAALLETDQGILFFHELRQGVYSIAAAVHP